MELTPFKTNKLARWDAPLNRDMSEFQRGMNDLVNDFFGRNAFFDSAMFDTNVFPAVDVVEQENEYLLEAEVPGLSKSDIDLDLHDNVLTICGEKKSEKKSDDWGGVRLETYRGAFRRDIPFSDEVNPDEVRAELSNGVLKVNIKKKENGKRSHRKIKL